MRIDTRAQETFKDEQMPMTENMRLMTKNMMAAMTDDQKQDGPMLNFMSGLFSNVTCDETIDVHYYRTPYEYSGNAFV
jgi:hypothetical protein